MSTKDMERGRAALRAASWGTVHPPRLLVELAAEFDRALDAALRPKHTPECGGMLCAIDCPVGPDLA